MKIEVPKDLFEELLEKLEKAKAQRQDFDRTVWGKLYSVLRQHQKNQPPGPREHSKKARAKAASRFKGGR